ncbi:probable multidrug resistance-associated protein lethal(2)03659 [Fopius arisanus]|uniref:L(2)03659_7 protein n=1 Tax=Fopius arisanus TaxID=64838 RepID=A0A0C9PVS6_9HYME|nr:PREDICTED: probable multidrug resistance-associated protein lethal(2)03659 [Fopius arisanus]XP_011301164.1 PREDICTED: probable multidrug resistance-associated protein lethal(2)03659 [Fopius arisanus]
MDGKDATEKRRNPREKANPLSALTFAWILKTFYVGYKRDLEIDDLTEPLKEHKSSYLGDKISAAWETELNRFNQQQEKAKQKGKKSNDKKKTPSLNRVLIKVFGLKVALYGVALAIMEIVLRVLQPLALGRLLRYYSTDNVTKTEAYLYASGVILCSAVNIFVVHPYMMAILHMGMKMRVACCSLIYRKALKLSRTALGETTVGQAVNLLSNDVNRFDVAIIFLHYLWIGPLETAIITYFMYQEVNISAVIGVASLLMFIPLQGWLGKKSSVLRLRTAIRTDERVRLTNEIISGIQAIKMYTWEHPFSALIENARKREIKVIRATSYIRGVVMSFIIFTTRSSLFLTILSYILLSPDNQINAEKIFMITAYYNILRQTMTVFFPQGITQMAEAAVSIRRLQEFLMYDEVSTYKTEQDKDIFENYTPSKQANGTVDTKIDDEKMGSIVLQNVSARWAGSEHDDTLEDINIDIQPGRLVAVVGQVGAGKSSLLNVILKELNISKGSIDVQGSMAYASQEPWLFAGSVRTNILFGRKMEQKRYDQVVKVCQLKRDFSLLPYGDKTIVGERGISLSGGQRARINLARAVYANAPIYLFDDPLSAVDAHVGKHMFEECIEKYLRGKTRILVTHQIQFLRNVEKIYVMRDGRIEAEGTYDELGVRGIDFGRLLENPAPQTEESTSATASRSTSRRTSVTSTSSVLTNDNSRTQAEPDEIAEMRTKGSIGGHIYASYFTAGGNWFIAMIIFILCAGAQLAASGGDYFIAFWVNLEEEDQKYRSSNETILTKNEAGTNSTEFSGYERIFQRDTCVYIFSGLTVATITITLVRSFAFFEYCMKASQKLHDKMFRSISRATMRFFNTNTSGRVLNRFSKDMGAIDELLPMALIDCVQIGLALLGIVVVVGVANPWLMIPTAIIGVIFYFLRVIYLGTSRSVKRLEGITRSPVFSHLNATLQGLATIRAFEAETVLTKEFDHHQDLHSSAWYMFIASSRAFGFWLDIFCLIYIALVTLSFLVLPDSADNTEGGNVGLAITQSIGLTGMFQWGMRQSAELENQMTSVERVLEYTNLESEPALESIPDKKPDENWPQEGKIHFRNVYLSYAPGEPPVLKNLNFEIKKKEKVGIVGRTGAGKSSLISALFRLADIEGGIIIDGVETSEIGLHDLRSKISIIPQEPFLFSGTLRRNLDPFDMYSDNLLWAALEDVELKEMGLTAHINEGGSNLSVGQRQLVCLARAIVKNNRILVLDEATANVDPRTDELIQKTIRSKFAECTVLTIAHRLNTVMDSDRILLMDAGQVMEFDHPHILLQNETGYLSSMVKETGKMMEDILTGIAKQNYENRQPATSL